MNYQTLRVLVRGRCHTCHTVKQKHHAIAIRQTSVIYTICICTLDMGDRHRHHEFSTPSLHHIQSIAPPKRGYVGRCGELTMDDGEGEVCSLGWGLGEVACNA